MKPDKLLRVAVFVVLLAEAYAQFFASATGDRNWLLFASGELLQHKTLYRDVVEVNPPLILWLYLLPAWLALHLPFTDGQILVALGFGLAAFTSWLVTRIMAHHPGVAQNSARLHQCGLLLMLIFITINPAYFADRDHIMLMCMTPYIVRCLPALQAVRFPAWLRVTVGVMGAVGFCLKPHAVIVFALLQLARMVNRRSLSALVDRENLIIYGLGCAYALALLCCAAEYLHVIFPMALATYGAYNKKIDGLVSCGFVAVILMGITFVDWRPRDRSSYRRDIYYLLWVDMAFLIYALLNNGWGYTYNPLLSFVMVTAVWVGWEFAFLRQTPDLIQKEKKRFNAGVNAAIFNIGVCTLVSLGMSLYVVLAFCPYQLRCYGWGRDMIETVKRDGSFATIALNFDTWPRLARATGAQWDTRFNHLWMMPQFILHDADYAEKNRWMLAYVAHTFAEDIGRHKPAVIFVEGVFTQRAPSFFSDLPAYFTPFPEFREVWSHYRFERNMGACLTKKAAEEPTVAGPCEYQLYRRFF